MSTHFYERGVSVYSKCNLCMRLCGKNRLAGELGFCKSIAIPRAARAALHMWEEPIISGTQGSGAIFFSGCSLGCIFCQNKDISYGNHGKFITAERLSKIMMELKAEGAHNINFVTPTHYAPTVREATLLAKKTGFDLPVIYNTGTYDTIETIKMLNDTVDVFLPDFKYYIAKTAKKYSNAENYPDVAKAAIEEMYNQVGAPVLDKNGLIKSGVVVRVLLLPAHLAEAKLTVKYLYSTYGNDIYISLMNQYTPMPNMETPLNRRVTRAEYSELVDYAVSLGVKNAFIQDFGTSGAEFIPSFDNTGV